MAWPTRRLRLENLESRRLLAAVNIPDDLTAQVGAQVSAPVLIDSAAGIRGAEVRIQYDPALLSLTPASVTAGTAWGTADTQVVANVDQATGTVIVFLSTPEGLPDAGGSLVNFAFTVQAGAQVGAETVIDLVGVRLNEGAIPVTPAPVPGPDPTDGRIVIVGNGDPGEADRIAGFVYADTNNDNLPGPLEGIPGVEVTLINLQTNATLRTTTNDQGAFEFTNLPAGSYRLVQTQPLAYLDGGPNELTVQLAEGQNLENQNFRELGLRPQFVYNRLLTTSALPVGSAPWIQVLRQINVDAATGTTAPANYAPASSATTASAAAASESQSIVMAAANDTEAAPPVSAPSGAEGESAAIDPALSSSAATSSAVASDAANSSAANSSAASSDAANSNAASTDASASGSPLAPPSSAPEGEVANDVSALPANDPDVLQPSEAVDSEAPTVSPPAAAAPGIVAPTDNDEEHAHIDQALAELGLW